MPKSILLVGQNSQLAQAVLRSPEADLQIEGLSHNADWKNVDLSRFDAIVNMAYDPLYMREAYDESRDFDLQMARKAHEAKRHYVMLSTRRVYGPVTTVEAVREDHPAAPSDHYGRNKLRTENAVQDLLGDRCTILRVANVYDFEPGRHTFFGIALKNLKLHNRITLDVSPFVKRDFIHVDDFASILKRVLSACPAGLYNLGSGTSTEVGKIALWLLEGYGQGELLVTSTEHRDAFQLDRSKLDATLPSPNGPQQTRERCIQIGSLLIGFRFSNE